jgi:DNA-binding CsgD family transcriptional regulator
MERILDEKAMVVSSSLLDWIPIIVDAGDSDLAKRAMAQAEDEVQEQRSREPDPRLTAARGFLEADSAATIAAIEHFDAIPHWQAAVAKELAARTLAGQGSKDEAKTLAAAALDNYENLGAEYLARRVSAAMRALGVRLMRRTTGRRPASGWEALTDAEVKVAELAAKGLTNVQIGERLFVTRHTVQTHLKHVFAKLGITSRVQLANEVARHRG